MLGNHFFVKIIKFFEADLGSGMKNSDPGSGMEKIRIQDGKNSDPGSTTLDIPHEV
jgi:hypothetical protein